MTDCEIRNLAWAGTLILCGMVAAESAAAGDTASDAPRADELCASLTTHANHHALNAFFAAAEVQASDNGLPEAIASRLGNRLYRYLRADLDGDQDPEHVIQLYDYRQQVQVVILDDDLKEVPLDIGSVVPNGSSLPASMSDVRWIRSQGRVHLLLLSAGEPTYVIEFEAGLKPSLECEFSVTTAGGARSLHVTTDYDRLLRMAGNRPWQFVLQQPWNETWAELLIAHTGDINAAAAGEDGVSAPLYLAALAHKEDAVQWLLKHGANPRAGASRRVLDYTYMLDPEIALDLLHAGADPDEHLAQLEENMERAPDEWRQVALVAAQELHCVPQRLLEISIERMPELVTDLAALNVPVRASAYYRHNGFAPSVPPPIQSVIDRGGRDDVRMSVTRLLSRPMLEAKSRAAVISFDGAPRGLVVARLEGPAVADQYAANHELELFGSALCQSLLDGNCGPEALQGEARSWAGRLAYTCPPSLGDIDPVTCRVLLYYRQFSSLEVIASELSGDSPPVFSVEELHRRLREKSARH